MHIYDLILSGDHHFWLIFLKFSEYACMNIELYKMSNLLQCLVKPTSKFWCICLKRQICPDFNELVDLICQYLCSIWASSKKASQREVSTKIEQIYFSWNFIVLTHLGLQTNGLELCVFLLLSFYVHFVLICNQNISINP